MPDAPAYDREAHWRAAKAQHAEVRKRFGPWEERGLARVYWVEDTEPYDDSYVDTWGEPPEEAERLKAEIRHTNELYGVWGCVVDIRQKAIDCWEHASSLWAITFNQDRRKDPYHLEVEADLMHEALVKLDRWTEEEARELRYRATYAGPVD